MEKPTRSFAVILRAPVVGLAASQAASFRDVRDEPYGITKQNELHPAVRREKKRLERLEPFPRLSSQGAIVGPTQ